ncbi:MAG: helix-turn-helix transcriptional regulator [Clostridia bacterium]
MRLRELRIANDLTQQEVADIAGLERASYVRYEHEQRNIPIEKLAILAKFYGVPLDYIADMDTWGKPVPSNEDRLPPDLLRIARKVDKLSSQSRKTLEDYLDYLSSKDNR